MIARLRQPSLLLPALLAVFFLSVYLLSGSSDLQHNGDTDLRYQTTQAIVDHHRLWIARPMWADLRVARGVGGHLYAFYAPGQAVFMIPFYMGGTFLAHHLGLPYDITTLYAGRSLDLFLAALLALLFFYMARAVGYSPRVSAVLTLVFGLATVVWPDAQSALEQTQVDLFVLAAVFAVWSFVKRGMVNWGWLALSGCFAGLAVFTRYDAALYLPLMLLYPLSLRFLRGDLTLRWTVTAAGVYGLAAAPWLAFLAWWNYARFGSPFLTGLHERTFGEPVWNGVLNLTVSPGKGIVWYLPLVFLLPFAVPQFYRRNPPLCVFFGVLVLLPLLFYANVLYWHGDPGWGPRYLYASVPYLVLPLGEIPSSWQRRSIALKGLAAVLVAASLILNLTAVSVTQWRFWYRIETVQQQTARLSDWTGQPFQWGAQHYHYYWTVRESPILIQLDDVYQVARLYLGDDKYRLRWGPDPWVSNPVDNYPVNSFAFWWADTRHPLLGRTTRTALALGLVCLALGSLALLLYQLIGRPRARLEARRQELDLSPMRSARS